MRLAVLILALSLGLLPPSARAQNAVTQKGTVTSGSIATWSANRQIQSSTAEEAVGDFVNDQIDTQAVKQDGSVSVDGLAVWTGDRKIKSATPEEAVGAYVNQQIGLLGGANLPVATTNAMLATIPIATTTRVVRVGVNTEGDALPRMFFAQTGSCTAAGYANDKGTCVDSSDGNSWLAQRFGVFDVRQYGATGDGVTDDLAAINAAITAAKAVHGCAYIPWSGSGYKISAAITLTGLAPYCIVSDPVVAIRSVSTGWLLHTTDTGCINLQGNAVSLYNISCRGNGATSTSPTQTVCLEAFTNNPHDSRWVGVKCSGYVHCFTMTDRMVINGAACDNTEDFPNLVNGYPQTCVYNQSPSTATEAIIVSELFCRAQSQTTHAEFAGDGSKNWVDLTLSATSPATGQAAVGWAADGFKVCVSPYTTSEKYPCNPLVIGTDFTVWDCGATACGGSGGTQLYVKTKTVATTEGNAQVVVAGGTSGMQAGQKILAWAEHDLPHPAYVVSIDDATHLTLSQAPLSTNAAVKYVFYEVNGDPVAAGKLACSVGTAPTCWHQFELRLTATPASGQFVSADWWDPWGSVAIHDKAGSEMIYDLNMAGGWRNLYETDGYYGTSQIRVGYQEMINYCMVIGEANNGGQINDPLGIEMHTGRNVQPTMLNGTNLRCPVWIRPTAENIKLWWNSSDWRQYEVGNTGGASGAAFLRIGSDTAPLPTEASGIELDLSDIKCVGASQLTLTASEDGSTFLAGTNYVYHVSDPASASVSYAAVASTGAAEFPLTAGNNLSTDGMYRALLRFSGRGSSALHLIDIHGSMYNAVGATKAIFGGGRVVGTPAPIKAIQLQCGLAGDVLSGKMLYRVVW